MSIMGSRGDTERVLTTIALLVNTDPDAAGTELLGNVEQLRDFMATTIITEVEAPTLSDLRAVHALRTRLRSIFLEKDEAARIEGVNSLLAEARFQPRLVSHDILRLHIHYFPSYARLSDHLMADCAMALALLLESGEGDRLRVCRAPDCARVFVDSSRNRSRLYCDSQSCGNRLHAAAYRSRQRA